MRLIDLMPGSCVGDTTLVQCGREICHGNMTNIFLLHPIMQLTFLYYGC